MLGFARRIVFFRVNRASGAEKSRLARATGSGVIGSSSDCAHNRTDGLIELFLFFDDAMLLHVLKYFLHWNGCVQRKYCTAIYCHAIVFCNSVPADRNGMAVSSLIVAVTACIILMHFAAERRIRMAA